MRRAIPLAFLLAMGCSGTENPIARAAGAWPGEFKIDSVDGKTDDRSKIAEQVKGTLSLLVNGLKYRLEMMSPKQKFTVNGTWKAEGTRVTLMNGECTFDNPSEEDQKTFNLRIISPDEIRSVFGRMVILEESSDRRRLTGLKASLGHLVGRLEFERAIPR